MTDRAPERLAALVGALVLGAVAAVVASGARSPTRDAAAEEFAAVTGGLGGGVAVSLVPCVAAFDAALDDRCAREFEPVPGGRAFCPHHGGAAIRPTLSLAAAGGR